MELGWVLPLAEAMRLGLVEEKVLVRLKEKALVKLRERVREKTWWEKQLEKTREVVL